MRTWRMNPALHPDVFKKFAHLEVDDVPTLLVEHDFLRIEDMVTKLNEDHQVVVGMNLELTTKLDKVFNRLHEVWMNFGPILSRATLNHRFNPTLSSGGSALLRTAGLSQRSRKNEPAVKSGIIKLLHHC
ncbi:hypothetical protein LWI28_028081 [Acer negundo]|uniref:Uncharacterized protein n=1 Tax=Acer negundo TaxID=4023 RepID=A0AAD5IP73_ACENE|nr:hypothetical protein LWI28_028081 [Acer negundo]